MPADPTTEYPEALARHYDQDYLAMGRTADVEFYVAMAARAAGPVLEVGCGTGRVLLPMARVGATVTGVDPSPLMRQQLLAKLSAEPEEVRGRVTVHAGRFQALPVPGPFALVCSPFRAFQHLYCREDQLAALQEMARVLAPDGLVAFDVFDFDPEAAARAEDGLYDCTHEDGVQRHVRSRFDLEQRLVTATFEWSSAEGAADGSAGCTLRIISRHELLELLDEAGLAPEAIHGDFDGSDWDPARPRELVVLARHRA
jgi:SAM-dependent methyltransferase